MVAKSCFLVCIQALLIQCAFSQCINRGPGLTYDGLVGPGLAGPYGCGCAVASTGGGFPVTSVSPLAPTGISVISENAIEGSVIVGGALPFLSAVVLDGVLPTAGTGAISYTCGDTSIGIVSEGPIATGIVGPGLPAPAYGAGLAVPAYGAGLAVPAYGAGLAVPAYGAGLAGPAYPGVPGLGLSVAGCGCGL